MLYCFVNRVLEREKANMYVQSSIFSRELKCQNISSNGINRKKKNKFGIRVWMRNREKNIQFPIWPTNWNNAPEIIWDQNLPVCLPSNVFYQANRQLLWNGLRNQRELAFFPRHNFRPLLVTNYSNCAAFYVDGGQKQWQVLKWWDILKKNVLKN